MATLSVGQSTPIYPSGNQEAVTLKNVGAEAIYVDNAPIPVGSGAGLSLGSGSSMIWDANKPLYAAAPLTGNGQLLVIENSGNLFDAQAIAVEIINAGLAQDIAQQIAINGAPSIDPLDLLYDINVPSTYPLPINYSLTDLKYRTLLVNITDEGVTQDANEFGSLTFTFANGAKQYTFQIPSGPTYAKNFLAIPVLGPSCNINYGPANAGGYVAINIRGSYNAYDYDAQYAVYQPPASDSQVSRSEKYVLLYANGLSTTAQRIKIPSRLGRCRFRINVIGSANNNTFQFLPYEAGLGNQYYYINTAVPSTGVESEIIFGDRPVCLRFQLATGNTGFSIVFMYD